MQSKKKNFGGNLSFFEQTSIKRTVVPCVLFLLSICAPVWAQSNVLRDPQTNEASTSSVLNVSTKNGRIGGYQYNGSLKPEHKSSRFNSGAVYGSGGNIVGIERNPSNSCIQSSSTFQSKQNYDLLALRNELRRMRALAAQETPNKKDPATPRLVTSHAPKKIPYAMNRTVRYGRSPEAATTSQVRKEQEIAETQPIVPVEPTAPSPASQNIWMRGRAPQNAGLMPDPWLNRRFDRSSGLVDYTAYPDVWNYDYGLSTPSSLGGALNLNDGNVQALAFPPIQPSEADVAQYFKEYLELQLLRSPDVNALSPIQVDYQDGVATIHGVVPTSQARIAAGKILLADPRVKKVNNQLTFVHGEGQEQGSPQPQLSTPAVSEQPLVPSDN